jgi:hypothetical protein
VPFDTSTDPYERVGVDRRVAKQWVLAALGDTKLPMRWSPKAVKEFQKRQGIELSKWKVKDITAKMVEAYPALKELERLDNIWATLQYLESNAIVSTMLILMREHGVPSLSRHDGLIVPWSRRHLAMDILKEQYRRAVGVTPTLTVEPNRRGKYDL